MKGWQERLGEEVEELRARTAKLARFVESPEFMDLSQRDRTLLCAQGGAMTAYLHILELRMQALVGAAGGSAGVAS